MSLFNYNEIKRKEEIIESNRLEIKKYKKEKIKLNNFMIFITNIYEYLVSPLCAISITLVAFFNGPIVYLLPALMGVVAIGMITYKYHTSKEIDKLEDKIIDLKKQRQEAYNKREELYEKIFNDLNLKHLDKNNYYHQIVNASRACEVMTESMVPFKDKKKKLEKIQNYFSKIFDYGLVAPGSTVILPIICSIANMGSWLELATMAISSIAIFGCVSVDERLSKKIDELNNSINEIKSDRTVRYVTRDLKLKEALDYLKKNEKFMVSERRIMPIEIKKTSNKIDNNKKKRLI